MSSASHSRNSPRPAPHKKGLHPFVLGAIGSISIDVVLRGVSHVLLPMSAKIGTAALAAGSPFGVTAMLGKLAVGSALPVVIRGGKAALAVKKAVMIPAIAAAPGVAAAGPVVAAAGPAAGSLIGIMASALF